MESNPYESPKGLEDAPIAPPSSWRWDHAQLLLGLAGIVMAIVSVVASQEVQSGYKPVFYVVAGALFVLGVVLMWGPISRHEDDEDDP